MDKPMPSFQNLMERLPQSEETDELKLAIECGLDGVRKSDAYQKALQYQQDMRDYEDSRKMFGKVEYHVH